MKPIEETALATPAGFENKVAFIWKIADKLHGHLKPHEYGLVMLPTLVLFRLDAVLEPTKPAVLARKQGLDHGSETLVGTHETNNCNAGHPGWAAPGQFGWLAKSSCNVSISGPEYAGVSGNSAANCAQPFLTSRTQQTPVYLPVYTSIDPVTGNYILDGFAAFVITGWSIKGQGSWDTNVAPVKEPSIIAVAEGIADTSNSDANYCGRFTGSNSDVCIYGYFTQSLIPASAVPTGSGTSNLGASVVALIG